MIYKIHSTLAEPSSQFLSFMAKEIVFSGVLFVIIFLLAFLLRKKSPFLHMGLWILVLIRLVLPPGFKTPVSKYHVLKNVRFLNEVQRTSLPSNSGQSLDIIPSFNPENTIVHSVTRNHSELSPGNQTRSDKGPRWKIVLFLSWLLGFLILLSIHIYRYVFYRRLALRSHDLRDEFCLSILSHWRRKFRVKRKIKIVSGLQNLSPFTVGILRPVIYLPEIIVASRNRELLNTIISHEVAHIKHFDDLWIKFQNLIQSVYFFYPLVWYANSKIQLSRECLRDTQVLSLGGIPPKEFGKGVIMLMKSSHLKHENILCLPGFINAKKSAIHRLKNLNKRRMRPFHRLLAFLMLLGIGLFLTPTSATSQPDALPESTRSDAVQKKDVIPERAKPFEISDPVVEPEGTVPVTAVLQDESSTAPSEEKREKPLNRAAEHHVAEKENVKVSGAFTEKYPIITNVEPALIDDVIKNIPTVWSDINPHEPLRIDGQYSPPKVIKKVIPRYPLKAWKNHASGTVILEATIDVDGEVVDVKIIRSIPLFDETVVKAVKQWRYEPMLINGIPQSVIFKVTVNFELER